MIWFTGLSRIDLGRRRCQKDLLRLENHRQARTTLYVVARWLHSSKYADELATPGAEYYRITHRNITCQSHLIDVDRKAVERIVLGRGRDLTAHEFGQDVLNWLQLVQYLVPAERKDAAVWQRIVHAPGTDLSSVQPENVSSTAEFLTDISTE